MENEGYKIFGAVAMLIIWSIVTFALTVSFIGLFVLASEMNDGGWFEIPGKCVNKIV